MIKLFISLLLTYAFLDSIWLGVIMRGFYKKHVGHLMRAEFSFPSAAVVYLLVVYGVYDFTNQAALDRWPLALTLTDITWGTFVCAALPWLMFYLKGRLMPSRLSMSARKMATWQGAEKIQSRGRAMTLMGRRICLL